MKYILSIDLGMEGAFVLMSGPYDVVKIWDMPTKEVFKNGKKRREVDEYRLLDIFSDCIDITNHDFHVVFEHLTPMSMGSVAVFSQGGFFVGMKWLCACMEITYSYYSPVKWKNYFSIGRSKNKDLSRGDLKDLGRLKALELFPDQADSLKRKKDVDRADAMLIGNYAYSVLN